MTQEHVNAVAVEMHDRLLAHCEAKAAFALEAGGFSATDSEHSFVTMGVEACILAFSLAAQRLGKDGSEWLYRLVQDVIASEAAS